MKNLAIIGCSISGSLAALLFSKAGMNVTVFEQKEKENIHEKVCANIVTGSFLKLCKESGINPDLFIKRRFSIAEFYSQTNSLKIPVEDYEIDRKMLLEESLKEASRENAEFIFGTSVLDFRKSGEGYKAVISSRGNNSIFEKNFDFIIGADGALSKTAKITGLWQKRNFWLAIQSNIPQDSVKNLNDSSYRIFFVPKLGYYCYIFPSDNSLKIGILANPDKAKEKFNNFCSFIGVSAGKIESALVPIPKNISFRKGNIFLLGDAACQIKFSGGGIVPAFESAFALRDLIVYRKNERINSLNKEVFIHRILSRILSRMNNKDFDEILDIAKKEKFNINSRDEMRTWIFRTVMHNPSLVKFASKLF